MPDPVTTQLHDWIERYIKGDRMAFNEMAEAFHPLFERLAAKILSGFPGLKRSIEVGDVVNDQVALKLDEMLRKLASENERGADGSPHIRYVLNLTARMMRNALVDKFRKEKLRHDGVLAVGAGPGEVEISDGGTHDPVKLARWTRFHEEVDKLPESLRGAFDLRYYHGLNAVETAELLGVSDDTVRRLYQRACFQLKKGLGDDFPGF